MMVFRWEGLQRGTMRRRLMRAGGMAISLWLVLCGGAPFTAPQGDLDLDGSVNVVDLQCLVLVYLQTTVADDGGDASCGGDADCGAGQYCRAGFAAEEVCLPECLSPEVGLGEGQSTLCTLPEQQEEECIGDTAKKNADLNCDGKIGNQDLGFVVAISLGKVGWEGTADVDGDGQLNFCDEDSDQDGAVDDSDCDPLDPQVGGSDVEECNGVDDDCDGQADEDLGFLACGIGACFHTVPACVGGTPQICDPTEGVDLEECNGADDDCDGQVDEDGSVGCSWYHADKDSDGWGAELDKKCLCQSNWQYDKLTGGDCYDDNWQAKPGQTGWFEDDRGDGSFDYNCDGIETYQMDPMFYCNGACNFSTPGWYGFKPLCGQNGVYATVCLDLFGWVCDIKNVTMQAACH